MVTRFASSILIALLTLCTITGGATEERNAVWSDLDIQVYTQLKVDAAFDDSSVTTGNFVKWVDPEVAMPGTSSTALALAPENDNEFNLTANQSRLGLLISGHETDTFKASGRVEVDFYGGSSEYSSHLRMRHVYLEFQDKKRDITWLAGQTSDVMSPLCPMTLNYTVMWWSGNMGYRRPQIRLTKTLSYANGKALKLQAAVARTIDDTLTKSTGTNTAVTSQSGADAGFPSLQARVGYTFPCLAGRPATIGLSGHWGQEEFDYINTSTGRFGSSTVDSWSGNVDLLLPLCKTTTLKGEAHTGTNLDNYCAGIGQGVSTGDVTNIQSMRAYGGWLALAIAPEGPLCYHLGGGTEKMVDADLSAGNRARNSNIFGNAIYAFSKHASVGAELSYWKTEYWNTPGSGIVVGDGSDWRVQIAFVYKTH